MRSKRKDLTAHFCRGSIFEAKVKIVSCHLAGDVQDFLI